jgi:hypothetical protein
MTQLMSVPATRWDSRAPAWAPISIPTPKQSVRKMPCSKPLAITCAEIQLKLMMSSMNGIVVERIHQHGYSKRCRSDAWLSAKSMGAAAWQGLDR